jgi:hypothetical protein
MAANGDHWDDRSVTFSASRLASALGAGTLLVATFLPWRSFVDENAWQARPALATALIVCAALAAFTRFAAAMATVLLVSALFAVQGDAFGATAAGPAVAFLGLAAIIAGGVARWPRWLTAAGVGMLVLSTFGAWTVSAIEGAYFNGRICTIVGGGSHTLWDGFGGDVGNAPRLAGAALVTIAAGVVTLARSR